jgi:hypothetical protein
VKKSVVAIILIVVTEKSRILSAPKVLLQTAFGLGVDVTLTTEKGQQHGEEDKSMCRSP